MADIAWPSNIRPPQSMTFGKRDNTWELVSQLTGAVQTVEVPGARWVASLAWGGLARADADLLQAVLVQLRGRSNRLFMHNLGRPNIKGVGGGTPLVKGAAQVGASVAIDGLPINTTGVYVAGDFLGIGGELKMVVASVNSNGGGEATVVFEPPLRASPADNSAIVTFQPTTRWIATNDAVDWAYREPMVVRDFSLELIEVFG